MRFTDLFIKKPVIAFVVNIAILVVGLVSFNRLNVRQYPRSDSASYKSPPSITVRSADTIAVISPPNSSE